MMSGETKTVIKGNSSKYVKLNVGGSLHYTTIGTLTKQDTMLRAMFSGRMEVLTDSEGNVVNAVTYIFGLHNTAPRSSEGLHPVPLKARFLVVEGTQIVCPINSEEFS